MKKVLVVCQGNTARSQMAEGYLRFYGKQRFEVYSAGFDACEVHPLTVAIMSEDSIDISLQRTNPIEYWQHLRFDYVILVGDKFPSDLPSYLKNAKQIVWNLPDPAKAKGTEEEKLAIFRTIREEIKSLCLMFIGQKFPLGVLSMQY